MHETETWLPVADLPHYLVSNLGRVRHIDRRDPRKLRANERGFVVVLLSSQNTATRYLRQVNKLVANAFLGPPAHESENAIWHIDGDLLNCEAANLRWEMRSRVLEWNEMHRCGVPKFETPRVKNNSTGRTYANAYACAIGEGILESKVLWLIEQQASDWEDDTAPFRYVFS